MPKAVDKDEQLRLSLEVQRLRTVIGEALKAVQGGSAEHLQYVIWLLRREAESWGRWSGEGYGLREVPWELTPEELADCQARHANDPEWNCRCWPLEFLVTRCMCADRDADSDEDTCGHCGASALGPCQTCPLAFVPEVTVTKTALGDDGPDRPSGRRGRRRGRSSRAARPGRNDPCWCGALRGDGRPYKFKHCPDHAPTNLKGYLFEHPLVPDLKTFKGYDLDHAERSFRNWWQEAVVGDPLEQVEALGHRACFEGVLYQGWKDWVPSRILADTPRDEDEVVLKVFEDPGEVS